MVNVSVGPVHPSKLGVTTTVAVTGSFPLFTTLNEPISPLPDEAKPILGVSFVQAYVVVPPVFSVLNVMAAVSSALHNIWLSITSTWPVGLTVIVNVSAGPVQLIPFSVNVGVTVRVATTGEVPSLTPAKEAMFPVPKSAKPMDGVSFVHA